MKARSLLGFVAVRSMQTASRTSAPCWAGWESIDDVKQPSADAALHGTVLQRALGVLSARCKFIGGYGCAAH
eukprot:m.364508 g.364508  ORF g.364508 m.364508 type:complete len:72 (+) comp20808_c0_seq43:1590-1805(+)